MNAFHRIRKRLFTALAMTEDAPNEPTEPTRLVVKYDTHGIEIVRMPVSRLRAAGPPEPSDMTRIFTRQR
jgi:hypothetical protein